VRGSGIDPVKHERVEMWRQVQRRSEALNESDRPIVSALHPMKPSRSLLTDN
jgi:hypothetical protein